MSLFYASLQPALDTSGNLASGAKWYLYRTGTTTALPGYTSADLATAHANPVVADTAGRFAPIFLDDSHRYRAVLETSGGATLNDIDPVNRFGTSRTVAVEMFGAVGDGATNDQPAIQNALDYLDGLGGGSLHFSRGKTYYSFGLLDLKDNIRVFGNGAKMVYEPVWHVGADISNVELHDIHCVTTSGELGDAALHNMFKIAGSKVRFYNTEWGKDPAALGTIGYLQPTASDILFDGFRCYGSHGVIVQGVDGLRVNNFHMRSIAIDGTSTRDDAWAIDAMNVLSRNVMITNGYVEGYYDAVALGSAIGSFQADDATYSKGLRNVQISNVQCRDCFCIVFMKPGIWLVDEIGGGSLDYRDGLVENVQINNCQLDSDLIHSGILIEAGNGAIIRDVRIDGITITGRAASGTGIRAALNIQPMNTGADHLIAKIYARGIHCSDRFGGAPDGTVGTTGAPIKYGVFIERETLGGAGNVGQVEIRDFHVDGAAEAGCYVGTNLAGPFRLNSFRSLNTAHTTTTHPAHGVYANSLVEVSDARITLSASASASARILGGAATGIFYAGEKAHCYLGNSSAATSSDFPWVAPADCYLYKIEVIATGAVPQNDTNYKTLRAVNQSTGPTTIAAVTTKTTGSGGVALAANAPYSMAGTLPIVGATAFLTKGQVLSLQALPSGAGVSISGLAFVVHYVTYGGP